MSKHIHQYDVIGETLDGIKERCAFCPSVLVTKKDRYGRINNKKWLKDHVADTAQPTGATAKVFKQLYGEPKV